MHFWKMHCEMDNRNPVPPDFMMRIAALENSVELKNIYNHPHWIKLMGLIQAAKRKNAVHKLRMWVTCHKQLKPLLSWFGRCTRKYGLSFDVFSFIPPSRLILQDFYKNRIRFHRHASNEHSRRTAEFEQLLNNLNGSSVVSTTSPVDVSGEDRSYTSCFSVLTQATAKLGIQSSELNCIYLNGEEDERTLPMTSELEEQDFPMLPPPTITVPHATVSNSNLHYDSSYK